MKKTKFSKKLLVCMFLFLLLFIIAMCVLFFIKGNEPGTLISCVFAFCGLEGGVLGWIKTTESKNNKNNESEDFNNELDNK